jgi:glycosyltransferase involved in cell wall biosynthesis
MRIAIDMQGALTEGSRPRGIGRYTDQLVSAMAALRGGHTLRLMLNANHADAAAEVSAQYGRLLSPDAVSLYRVPRSQDFHLPATAPLRQVGDAILRRHVAGLQPDVMMTTSLFESSPGDFSPPDLARYPARLTAGILYDLIPLLFENLYLRDPNYERFYRATADSLRNIDLLLAISESAKRDAVSLLGVDPARVVNISAAADDRFRPVEMAEAERMALRARVGIARPFVMYVSGADPRKNLQGAVSAFAALPAALRQKHQLLLVTTLRPEDVAALRLHGESMGMEPDGLVVASNLDDEALARLFNLATAFIFPSLYEGFGLPILEAMQCGTPVLAADNSSIPEIVNRPDILFDAGSTVAAAEALGRVLGDEALRRELSDWGIRRARDFTWENSARRALSAMEERLAGRDIAPHVLPAQLLELDGARAELAVALAPAPQMDAQVPAIVDDLLFSVPQFRENGSRRLLIDATMTQATDMWTGIQRVVRQLTASFYEQEVRGEIVPLAVRLEPEAVFSVPEFVATTLHRPPVGHAHPVEPRAGDDLFMLDSSWEHYARYIPVFHQVEKQGGRIVTCVYDLIPELYPEVCVDSMPALHARWLENAVAQSHGLICISRAVADELITYIRARNLPHRAGLRIGWFHCGADIVRAGSGRPPQQAMLRAFDGRRPVFVSVGTLEPRKAQALALDAFETLWARGVDAGLCLIGKPGWKVEALASRLQNHPEFGKRLHWFTNAKDVDVVHAYNHAEAVLCTSMAEGFGLPIAEAGLMDKPVICSDIPVFREVGGEGAVYFPSGDADGLADTLQDWLAGKLTADPAKVSRNSWADAALRIREVLYDGDWYQTLD